MQSKIQLDLSAGRKRVHMHLPSGDCCRNHMVVVPGTGDKNFKFPPVEELVIRALSRLASKGEDSENPTEGSDGEDAESASVKTEPAYKVPGLKPRSRNPLVVFQLDEPSRGGKKRNPKAKLVVRYNHTFVPGLPDKGTVPAPLIPAPVDRNRNNGATLFTAAQALREIMDEGRFDAIIADRFDPLAGAVNWAKLHMEARFQPAIESLGEQLRQLRALYKDALPRVLRVLEAQNPQVPEQILLEVSVQVLDEELIQILTVLRIWTDAFAQHRDQMYEQLGAVTQLVEECFMLNQGVLGAKGAKLHTHVYQVGNVFVARFGHVGPATLPAKGPIGAHAIEVPMDERNIITLMLALYAHEFRHDFFHDVEGLEDELRDAVARAILEAYDAGKIKLTTEETKLGRQKVKTIELLVKLIADTIGEVDADISGGVLLTGPAFLYNMILSFSAFNAKGRTVESTPRLLRSTSYYELTKDEKTGAVMMDFFPHPPDYIRTYIVAAALDEIGFIAEGNECRELADIAYGDPLPQVIRWVDASGKSKMVIEIAVEDIKAVASVVARALIRTPLKALGGFATCDFIYWDSHKQAKAEKLAQLLMSGKFEIPADMGDVYANYVAAAATLAYWGACANGKRAKLVAAPMIEQGALAMLAQIREMRKIPAVVAPTGDGHESCVHGNADSHAEGGAHSEDAPAPAPAPADSPADAPKDESTPPTA